MARKTERLEAEIAVKDNATKEIEKVIKSNQKLSTEVMRVKANMDKMKKTSQQRMQIKMETAKAKKQTQDLKKAIDDLKKSGSNAMRHLKTFGTVVGGALVAGFGMAIKSGLELEKQMASITHFIGVNDKKLTPEQAGKQANQYMDGLKKYASSTPFSTNDVMEAGNRAVGVAGGDTKMASNLVKVAGDMAALTPGRFCSVA